METQVRATNAETGEEEVLVKPKPYWRKAKRGKPTPVEVTPEIPDDERGVRIDGGNRIAVGADGLGGVMESEAEPLLSADLSPVTRPDDIAPDEALNSVQNDDSEGATNGAVVSEQEHPEPSEMSEEDLAALYELAASDPEQSVDSEAQHSEAEQESEQEHNESQTNPARLLAAAE